MFYLLTIQVWNDARRETLMLKQPGVWIIDDAGRRYAPIATAANPAGLATLSQPVPAGSAYPTVLAFDLPEEVSRPRLLVTEMESVWPDKLLELFLIGNEDSLLHRKTTLAVTAESHPSIKAL
jgi:hypothetical protein